MSAGIVKYFYPVSPGTLDWLREDMDELLAEGHDSLLLHIRSYGGYSYMVPETARYIEKISESVPVYAYTDCVMASAAYWLACGAREIYAAPTATIGSIGAYAEHFDYEKNYLLNHIEHFVFAAGDRKARLLDGQIDEQEKAEIQEGVDRCHRQFKEFVLKRRKLEDKYLQGNTLEGGDAFAVGMIDGLADSVYELVTKLEGERIWLKK